VARLERLSADSRWARRASGLRGNIMKVLEESESGSIRSGRLDRLIDSGFTILEEAAREIPELNTIIEMDGFGQDSDK
jgi:hypothetical protein